MAIKVQDAGTLRTIRKGYVKVGGVLRTLKRIYVNDNGTLRTVAVFADPPVVTVADQSGTQLSDSPTLVSRTVASSVAEGLSPFTYSWVKLSGSFTLTNATSASCTVSETLSPDTSSVGTVRCTVTDASGQSDSDTATITLICQTPPIGGGA